MITTLADAERFLNSLPHSKKTAYDERISRAKLLYSLIGDPQESFMSVHIAGTSGKGSIATITAALLQAAGKSVGLTLSPHTIDIRERFQINNAFITEAELCQHLETLIPHLDTVAQSKHGPASYFEVVTAIAFLTFQKHRIDYAVIEVGMGGTRDATNAIKRNDKLSVIGQIGLDHTDFLGTTPTAIAAEKAGIMQPGGAVIALSQDPVVNVVFEQEASERNANLELFVPGKHVQHIHLSAQGTVFNLKLKPWIWRELQLGLVGRHQAINAGLAIRAVQFLCQRDEFELSEQTARVTLAPLRFSGRFDIRQVGRKTIILDGAHNRQKFDSLIATLKDVFPKQKFDFILGYKSQTELEISTKLFSALAANITPIKVTLSGTSDRLSVRTTLDAFLQSGDTVLVVTGSFYLVGSMYNELNKRGIT